MKKIKISCLDFSVQPLFSLLCILFLSSVSLSCSLFFGTDNDVSSEEEGTGNANFIVEEIIGRVEATRVNGLPEEIRISYKACFRDFTHPDNTLQNSLFKIHLFENYQSFDNQQKEDSGTESSNKRCLESSSFLLASKESCLEMRTDSSGCLNWTEIYPYHPVNQSVWFRYERVFEGTGSNGGISIIPMAMNPWLSLDPSGSAEAIQLVDLRYHPIDQGKTLIDMKKKDQEIAECRACSLNKDTEECELCKNKKRSLSFATTYFAKRASRPQLWLSELNSTISQENILINDNDLPEELLKTLNQFKVCHKNVKTEECDPPGRFFRVRLQMPLRIQVRNYRNEQELLPLTRGNYSIKAYLFLKNDRGKNIILHRDMGFVSTELVKGSRESTLNTEFHFHVPYENYGLPAYLGLRIESSGEGFNSSFIPFEGVFAFPNQLRSVIGRNTLSLEKEVFSFYKKNQFKDISLLKNYNFSGSWDSEENEGFRRAGWDVRLKRLRFSNISLANNQCATPVDRTVRYVGEVCIIDPLTNASVPNTQITIQRQNIFFTRDGQSREGEVTGIPEMNASQKLEAKGFKDDGKQIYLEGQSPDDFVVSDTSGCIQWMDQIYHKWYNREHYFVRKMIFSKKEWGFEGERMIAINPWHWGFLFFQDVTDLDHDKSVKTAVIAKRAERPQFVLHDFRSLYPDLIYTIDRWLGINIFQNLMFLFRVKVDRPDDSASGQGGQKASSRDVRRGYYFLRFLLVKSHTEETGGGGNQAINAHSYQKEYRTVQPWNTNTGWKIGRDGSRIGQMMSTNIEYITHFDTYVQIRDGVVNAYTNFLFDLDEFIFIGSNNRLIVQLLPTDPKYYKYYGTSCEVNPNESHFIPFPGEGHELIARPFMGTFVPGDQRNWNIFKPLNEYVNLDIPGNDLNTDIMSLDMTPEQVDYFIEMEKKHGLEHELFTKLQTNIAVRTKQWSKKSLAVIQNIGSIVEQLYEDLYGFLAARPGDSELSDFNQKKNKLIETIHKTTAFVSTALNGPHDENNQDRNFFIKLSEELIGAVSLLDNSSNSGIFLQKEMEKFRKDFINLVSDNLSTPLSATRKNALLQQKQKNKQSVFSANISFPKDPKKWSGFNMNMFAGDEGLKVLTMNDDMAVNKFLDDLNDTAKNHNKYYFASKKVRDESLRRIGYRQFNDGMANEIIQSRNKSYNELSSEKYEELLANHREQGNAFWNNFELIDGDNYHAIEKKVRQMYLPEISRNWLNTVLLNGIHTGTIDTPEVMSFLHSLCGFWFDKFYDEYLEQQQLDIIFKKHMQHFKYYKTTLEYLLEDKGPVQQYFDLNETMKRYNLVEMDQDFLTVRNPFLVHDTSPDPTIWEEWFGKEEDSSTDVEHHTVTQSLYEGKAIVLKRATRMNAYSNIGMAPSSHVFMETLNTYRHPYFKCVANPFNFFHLEKKIIVGDIGTDYSDIKYEYGITKSFNVQRAFDYAYSATWSMSRSFSTSLGAGVTSFGTGVNTAGLDRFLSPLRVISPIFAFAGIKLGSDWSTSRSESDQNRRQQSLRFADESLYLQTQHSAISIRLKNYRHCLVLRAANLAFDGYDKETIWTKELEDNFIHQVPYIKSGLMICSDDIDAENQREPFYITEDYFYFYQQIPGDRGQFQNALSYRNRPFVMSIRGITELEKFTFNMHSYVESDKTYGVEDYDPFDLMTNPYNTISKPSQGIKEAVYWAKAWDKTGFYPGVYNVKYDEEHYYFNNPEEREKGALERTAEWFYENNPFGFIRFDNTKSLYERRHSNQ